MVKKRGEDTGGQGWSAEEMVDGVRADIRTALEALIRVQPHLTTLKNSEELEAILELVRLHDELVGSRAMLRDLVLAEIAFIHLNNDGGNLDLVWKCIETLQYYGDEILGRLKLNDASTLIKAQLLRVMAHLRGRDRQPILESIEAFEKTAIRFQVAGDRDLVDLIRRADSRRLQIKATKAVRDKLLRLFQDDVELLIRIVRRTNRDLLSVFGGSESTPD
jgi:hypothetical protein